MVAGSENEHPGVDEEMMTLVKDYVRHNFSFSLLGFRCAKLLQQDLGILVELNDHLQAMANVTMLHVSDTTTILRAPQELWLFPLESGATYEEREYISMAEILEKLGRSRCVKDVMDSVCPRWEPLAVVEMLQLVGYPEPLERERDVCLKVLRVFSDDLNWTRLVKDLSKEILLWTQLQHPNILEFLGINTTLFEGTATIVSPWMSNGNVMAFARNQNATFEQKMRLIRGVVSGISYLHEHNPPIIHGDIKGMNVLVKDDEEPCIADFGLCAVQKETVLQTASRADERGSLPWLAPELLNPDDVPTVNGGSRDIYALGCTIAEVLSGSPPFSEKTNPAQIILAVLLRGERPKRPVECPDWLWLLMESCWHADATKRPGVIQVRNQLNENISISGHAVSAPAVAPITTATLSPLRRPTSFSGAQTSATRSPVFPTPAEINPIADSLRGPDNESELTARLPSARQSLRAPSLGSHHVLATNCSEYGTTPIAAKNEICVSSEGCPTRNLPPERPTGRLKLNWRSRIRLVFLCGCLPCLPSGRGEQELMPVADWVVNPSNSDETSNTSPKLPVESLEHSNGTHPLRSESRWTESDDGKQNVTQTESTEISTSPTLYPATVLEPNEREGASGEGPSSLKAAATMSSVTSFTSVAHSQKRNPIACDECRSRKVRCEFNVGNQKCVSCKAKGIPCTYKQVSKPPRPLPRPPTKTNTDGGGILLHHPDPYAQNTVPTTYDTSYKHPNTVASQSQYSSSLGVYPPPSAGHFEGLVNVHASPMLQVEGDAASHHFIGPYSTPSNYTTKDGVPSGESTSTERNAVETYEYGSSTDTKTERAASQGTEKRGRPSLPDASLKGDGGYRNPFSTGQGEFSQSGGPPPYSLFDPRETLQDGPSASGSRTSAWRSAKEEKLKLRERFQREQSGSSAPHKTLPTTASPSSNPGRSARISGSWPTAEEEKSKLWDRASAAVARTQAEAFSATSRPRGTDASRMWARERKSFIAPSVTSVDPGLTLRSVQPGRYYVSTEI
ncbi:Homeobox protein tos8 [Marasmius crinis-equi]|uniref:Homeobox protein tos8 n=1 Tax=Marasmius crinis-equi TaxID=585013 RepID=A0ABR3FFV3_9AGAR